MLRLSSRRWLLAGRQGSKLASMMKLAKGTQWRWGQDRDKLGRWPWWQKQKRLLQQAAPSWAHVYMCSQQVSRTDSTGLRTLANLAFNFGGAWLTDGGMNFELPSWWVYLFINKQVIGFNRTRLPATSISSSSTKFTNLRRFPIVIHAFPDTQIQTWNYISTEIKPKIETVESWYPYRHAKTK